jgi:diguanylate cyclase (GGDEF)-like protein
MDSINSSELATVAGSDDSAHGRLRPRLRWFVVSIALTVVGVVGSVFAAGAVGRDDANKSQKSFERSSGSIASTLLLAIQRQDDLVVDAGAYVLDNPITSQAGFVQWTNSAQAFARFPELQAVGVVFAVPADGLAAYAARAEADPSGPLNADGTFSVVPAGPRAFYCLTAVARSRSTATSTPAGFDACAGSDGITLLAARDSGIGTYQPYRIGNQTSLGIETPIYAGGAVPTTTAARQAAFVGWVGTLTEPTVLLERALQGYPNMSVSLHYHVASSDVTFASGQAPTGAHTGTTNLTEGWYVTTSGAVSGSGIFADATAVEFLTAGVVLSVLIGLCVFMLGTGRERARRLVDQRTGQLRHQALHDALTGLPNRVLILDRISQLLARNDRNGTLGAALYVDLDGFKNVNDTLGHGTGDRLLQAVAERLTTTLRDVDTIGWMGGDEFVVLIDGATVQVAPELVAERLLEAMRQPFIIDGAPTPIVITGSVGIAAGRRQTPEELLRQADMALYQAKAAGRNCHETFGEQMGNDILHRYGLEFDLRLALEDSQYRLRYQPMYNLESLSLAGAEALLRWEHPTLGLIGPDEFIPLLEASGQIIEVGRWVLLEACTQMAKWRADGHDLTISVNVSGRQLDRDSVIDHVEQALTVSGLTPGALTLEITETALMRNMDVTSRRLRDLKTLGVKIAIDDFGTGYSSIAYLQGFPVDSLKIDKSFTDTIARSRESDALIRTLLQFGADLGLKTVAEGVESQSQVDYLCHEHVTEVQGFLFAKPLTADALEAELLHPKTFVGRRELHESATS